MVEACLVQRLLGELKQSNPLSVTSHNFSLDNYCLQLIIINDYMQVLMPNMTHYAGNICSSKAKIWKIDKFRKLLGFVV